MQAQTLTRTRYFCSLNVIISHRIVFKEGLGCLSVCAIASRSSPSSLPRVFLWRSSRLGVMLRPLYFKREADAICIYTSFSLSLCATRLRSWRSLWGLRKLQLYVQSAWQFESRSKQNIPAPFANHIVRTSKPVVVTWNTVRDSIWFQRLYVGLRVTGV
jgi:hypothetical protein